MGGGGKRLDSGRGRNAEAIKSLTKEAGVPKVYMRITALLEPLRGMGLRLPSYPTAAVFFFLHKQNLSQDE